MAYLIVKIALIALLFTGVISQIPTSDTFGKYQ